MTMKLKIKRILTPIIFFAVIPLLLFAGAQLFGSKSYALIAAVVALVACVPFFLSFDKRGNSSRELMVIAVMTAVSVVGRIIFSPVPAFKPVTAIVIISAIYLGGEPGFIIGALSALVSNISFGQGAWTPFQMLSWGLIGYLSGLAGKTGIMKKWWALLAAGVIGGVLFSVVMDVWTVLSFGGGFNLNMYKAAIISALPLMVIYSVSNVIFLFALSKPIGEKLNRIKTKYGIFTRQ